jgi:predicted phosphodiesterase
MKKTNYSHPHKLLIYSVLLLIALLLPTYSALSKQINKPWLQGLDGNRLYVLVEADNTNKITVHYSEVGDPKKQVFQSSTKFTRQTSFGGETYVHRILLQNLHYGSEYEYWIDKKEKYTFRVPKESGEFTFVNMGDSRSGIKIWNKIVLDMSSEKPDFMIFNGDLAYKKDYKYWIDEFFTDNAQTMFSQYPFYNTPGNHERWNENTMAFTQSTAISKEETPFYSFEKGDALFLILNTEVAVGQNSQQWKFAVEQLKNSNKKWKIVAFHIPAYSSGGSHGENKAMKLMTEKIFEKYGVDLILTGHSHYYQHNLVNGIHHMVIGSAGSPLYTPVKADYTVKQAKKYHYAVINVNSERIKLTIKGMDKEIIDEFEIKD